MSDTRDELAAGDALDMLDSVDYREVVAILQKQYPLMDAEEVVRLVLKQINQPSLASPSSSAADDTGSE